MAFAYLVGKATLGACRAVAMASLLPAPWIQHARKLLLILRIIFLLRLVLIQHQKREDVQASLLKFIAEYARFEMGQTRCF